MVFEPEDVSLSSVGRGDSARFPNAEASDRSLSYVDLRFGRKVITRNRKVFESVRKFGRPRQQCSDVFAFLKNEENYMWQEDDGHLDEKEFFFDIIEINGRDAERLGLKQFGSETKNRLRDFGNTGQVRRKTCECYSPGCEGRRPVKSLPAAGNERYEFDNIMYRWNENFGESSFKESAVKTASSRRSSAGEPAPGTSRYLTDGHATYFEEDPETQIQPRYKREVKKSEAEERPRDYFGHCASEGNADGEQARISDIRENWRLRILREDEEKLRLEEARKRLAGLPKRKPAVVDEVDVGELHRSKSTPDIVDGATRCSGEQWNESEDRKMNSSLMDVYSRNWGVYNEQQEADSLNDPTSLNEPVSSPEPLGTRKLQKRFASGKNFFGHFITSRATTPTAEMLDYKEPFSQLWMVLSSLYGQALIILMLAFCLTEVMDNSVKLLTLQGVFLMYLYVGSIGVIICIYIWVLVDSCSSFSSPDAAGLVPPTITTSIVADRERELRNMPITKFGSLKKAHISRDRTSSTSFYLRIGAIAFGLGTLVFNGLEMAMHSMMAGSCLNDVVFVHPILHGLFTFLQMHFLFVNSQVLVERFGLAARFGFMHLTATNLALWIRLIIWESGNEWTYFVHLSQTNKAGIHSPSEIPTPLQLRGFPKFVTRKERDISFSSNIGPLPYQPISDDHISQVVSLHHCLNTNSLGQLWTSSMPFLYPFIIQFSLIAAAVTFVMGQNVAKDRLFFQKQKKTNGVMDSKTGTLPSIYDNISSWGVDCNRASKGLFLGLLCLVTGVVVIIIFLVVKEDEDFPADTIFWLTNGTLLTIITITTFMNIAGLVQIRKLSVIGRKMTKLDSILSVISMLGVQLYTTFGILVGAVGLALDDTQPSEGYFLTPNQKRHTMLLCLSMAQLLQTTMQSSLISEGIRRTSLTRNQILTKPARQIITFLLFSNSVLWAFDTFVVQSWMSQELQLRFFGVLVWGVISRIGLPLLVFFRFHSCVLLLEIWKRSYQSLHIDPGN